MEKPKSKSARLGLSFILGFCLISLASWLFIPWLIEDSSTISIQKDSSEAVAELMESTLPDNVFFSPLAHNLDSCNQCHSFDEDEYTAMFNLEKTTTTQDDITQVFFEAKGIIMAECLSCHEIKAHLNTTTASEACSTCHK